MRRLLIALVLPLLAGCEIDSVPEETWVEVSEGQFPFVYADPGLEMGMANYQRANKVHRLRRVVRKAWGRWSGSSRIGAAEGELVIVRAHRAAFVPAEGTGEMKRAMARALDGRTPLDPVEGRDSNVFGEIDYIHYGDREADCLVFQQTWLEGMVLTSLVGRYCRRGETKLTPQTIHTVLTSFSEK